MRRINGVGGLRATSVPGAASSIDMGMGARRGNHI
jgi:hypothetical protein